MTINIQVCSVINFDHKSKIIASITILRDFKIIENYGVPFRFLIYNSIIYSLSLLILLCCSGAIRLDGCRCFSSR
jgi:hypothetical protein